MTREEFLINLKSSTKISDQNPVNPKYHSSNPTPSVRKQWVLDAQWTDCPDFVEAEVKKMWRNDDRLYNDVCVSKQTVDEELLEEYPNVYHWLVHNGVPEGAEVWVHWWW